MRPLLGTCALGGSHLDWQTLLCPHCHSRGPQLWQNLTSMQPAHTYNSQGRPACYYITMQGADSRLQGLIWLTAA